jgi:hypothetical protein
MKRIVTAIGVVGAALVPLPATTADARQPLPPEQVQVWATTLPRQPNSQLDRVYSPLGALHVLDQIYAVMVRDLSEDRPGDAWTKGGEGSKAVDRYRRLLVHSPDKDLNKLMNRALNRLGDVFDEVNITATDEAAETARRSNRLWTQVEARLKADGVDTGEPWSLSTVN